ncbi:predicted protein [Paecilomyces variotii No. 5]|uniref:Aminoglycoside phosphotransferase domain-containing protein n=1 Tax=Byssochlamys spectabilis (strain No. 5 / NBRC 109023) TaxID=1356009 RepID=V5F745_BYSSN|nr:predicted protein [Paecilomyces variotii No. 5]
MSVERHLLRRTITYSQAKDEEVNIVHQLGYWYKRNDFFEFMRVCRRLIEKTVAHHLTVSPGNCYAADVDEWMNGSFNLCVPVKVKDLGGRNSDEKVSCEAATYSWMQQFCPAVPIPRLHGFALGSAQRFTFVENLSFCHRLVHRFRCCWLSFLGYQVPSNFVRHDSECGNELGPYIIVDYIKEGKMLSTTWKQLKDQQGSLRKNLFRDISKITLAMSRIKLPKIGSFIIDENGYLRLANRPLTLMLHDLENQNIPVDMPRDRTFSTVDSYVNSLLICHDNRLRFQPNAVKSPIDCVSQMTALTLMRTVRPHFFDSQLNDGPFVFSLTDLHASNILVDENWHIKCLIDLEWAASLPIEFMRPPIWLTSKAVDEIDVEEYNAVRKDFVAIFQQEEKHCPPQYKHQRTEVMEKGWELGAFWYSTALRSPTALHAIFYNHIQPPYGEEDAKDNNFYLLISPYWGRDPGSFIRSKLEDKSAYDTKLRELFQGPSAT